MSFVDPYCFCFVPLFIKTSFNASNRVMVLRSTEFATVLETKHSPVNTPFLTVRISSLCAYVVNITNWALIQSFDKRMIFVQHNFFFVKFTTVFFYWFVIIIYYYFELNTISFTIISGKDFDKILYFGRSNNQTIKTINLKFQMF